MKIFATSLLSLVLICGFASAANAASGTVVYEEWACDYFIVEDDRGTYALLEWFGGRVPIDGYRIYGDYNSYGFKNVQMGWYYTSQSRIWVEDYWLSGDSAVRKFMDKCY